jgi:hypothetical protein
MNSRYQSRILRKGRIRTHGSSQLVHGRPRTSALCSKSAPGVHRHPWMCVIVHRFCCHNCCQWKSFSCEAITAMIAHSEVRFTHSLSLDYSVVASSAECSNRADWVRSDVPTTTIVCGRCCQMNRSQNTETAWSTSAIMNDIVHFHRHLGAKQEATRSFERFSFPLIKDGDAKEIRLARTFRALL